MNFAIIDLQGLRKSRHRETAPVHGVDVAQDGFQRGIVLSFGKQHLYQSSVVAAGIEQVLHRLSDGRRRFGDAEQEPEKAHGIQTVLATSKIVDRNNGTAVIDVPDGALPVEHEPLYGVVQQKGAMVDQKCLYFKKSTQQVQLNGRVAFELLVDAP